MSVRDRFGLEPVGSGSENFELIGSGSGPDPKKTLMHIIFFEFSQSFVPFCTKNLKSIYKIDKKQQNSS